VNRFLIVPATWAVAAAATFALAACTAEDVSPEPLGDYRSWKRIDTYGEIPGHSDSYRIIYVNDLALGYAGGSYPEGSVVVKEIRKRDGATPPGPGDLDYLAIMRRIGPAPRGLDDEAGWLFTQISQARDDGTAGAEAGEEKYRSLCWNRCHVAAPYAGAFLDYGK
jgi:Cytochrome P460